MDRQTITELAQALERGDRDKALACVQSLRDVEFCDPAGGLRALHYAVRFQDLQVCEALIKRRADVNAKTLLDTTPLQMAVDNEVDDALIIALINAGAHGELPESYAHLTPGSSGSPRSSNPHVKRKGRAPQSEARSTRQGSTKSSPQRPPQGEASKNTPISTLSEVQKQPKRAPLSVWLKDEWPALTSRFDTWSDSDRAESRPMSPAFITRSDTSLINDIGRLTREAERDPTAWLELGLLYRAFGAMFEDDATEALVCYERALSDHPERLHLGWLVARAIEMSPATSGVASPGLGRALLKLYRELASKEELILADEEHGPFSEVLSALNSTQSVGGGTSGGHIPTIEDEWTELSKRLPELWARDLKEPMGELMGLVGLGRVKRLALDLIRAARMQEQLDQEARVPQTLNFALLGNPGTGKTTAARLLGRVLHAIDLRASDHFEEVTARALMNEGLDDLHDRIEECEGGVLFVDEAYAFNPEQNERGREIFEELLVIAEQRREEISIFLAGYQRDMEQKLFSYNEGLASRFTRILLEDFTESELYLIWRRELDQRDRWEESGEEVGRVVAQRLGRRSGSRGFGNAREIRNTFERCARAALSRRDREGATDKALIISLEDVIGAPPSRETVPELDRVLTELEGLTGQAEVKERFFGLVKLAENNHNRELRGERPHQVALNRLFLGNPGTGKTTTARLYGRLLKSLGLLSDGEVLERSASDLVGSVVGESQRKTRALLELARGKVLLIDEAYSLNDSLYGKQALDTLVEQVSGAPGADISVVMCGYTREMEELLRMQNPGLSRRFPRDQAFMFADFTDDELFLIAKRTARASGLSLPTHLALRMVKELGRKRAIPHFGNAGEVQLRLSRAKERLAARSDDPSEMTLCEADLFSEAGQDGQRSPLRELEAMGIDPVTLESFRKFEAMIRVHERDGGSRPLIGHMQFIGNAGTGKTTVARLMGRLFYDLGVLARDHVEETSGLDLTGAYLGQTKGVVQERLEAAAGGVLFIDEAYQLAQGQYGSEAVTTLVQLMTEPRYDRDKTLIILAGYEDDMGMLMRSNQGLAGRFKNRVIFADWTPERCLTLLRREAEAEQLGLSDDAAKRFVEGCAALRALSHWANARDVRTLWDEARGARALRVCEAPEDTPQLTEADIEASIGTLLATRLALDATPSAPISPTLHESLAPLMSAPPSPQAEVAQAQVQAVEAEEENSELDDEVDEQTDEKTDKELIQDAQDELNALTEELMTSSILSKEAAGEGSFEAALERQLSQDPNLISDLPNRDLSNPGIQAAMGEVIERLVHEGMDPEEAQRFVEREVKRLLTHSRKARRLQAKLEKRLKELVPIYACGYCGRPWGNGWNQCTYMGPVIIGYKEVEPK